MQIARQLGVVRVFPQQPRQRPAFAVAGSHEIEVLGIFRQELLDDVKIRHQHPRDLFRRQQEEIAFGPFLAAQAGGPDKHQAMNPVAVLHREVRREKPAERKSDQMEFVEAERVKQVEIMHDVIVHLVHRRVVVLLAKARMKRDDDAEFLRPGNGEIDAVPNAGAVQKHQWLALARAEHGRFEAVDGVVLA